MNMKEDYSQVIIVEKIDDVLLKQLIKREDIILTPHIAFYTEAAVKNLIVDALDATMDVLTSGTTKLRVIKIKKLEYYLQLFLF